MMENTASGNWSVGHGTLRGKPVHFSVNRVFDSCVEKSSHRYEADFAVAILEKTDSGLPSTDAELAELRRLEDWFSARLPGAVLAVVVTTDGKRDFVFYTSEPDALVRFFEEEVKPAATRSIELTVEENDYRLYRMFSNADSAASG